MEEPGEHVKKKKKKFSLFALSIVVYVQYSTVHEVLLGTFHMSLPPPLPLQQLTAILSYRTFTEVLYCYFYPLFLDLPYLPLSTRLS